jgi:hypothetical protein
MHPTALGKKNWLFIGDAEAGERGAIIHTIIESFRRRSVEPFGYLREAPESTALDDQQANPDHHAGSLESAQLQRALNNRIINVRAFLSDAYVLSAETLSRGSAAFPLPYPYVAPSVKRFSWVKSSHTGTGGASRQLPFPG